MGKISKHGPKKATSTVNKHKERECEGRKQDLKKRIELKRMLSEIDYLKDELRGLHVKEMKIDPLYDLRGAARAARESYPDPNLVNQPQVINYMEQSAGQLWEVPQGSELLTKMKAYSEACISLLGRTLDAIQVLEEMIEYDLQDHLDAHKLLLRLYVERKDKEKVKQLIERFASETTTSFLYCRILLLWSSKRKAIEKDILPKALESNVFLAVALSYPSIFLEVIDRVEELKEAELRRALELPNSVEEAFLFFYEFKYLWQKAEGLADCLRDKLPRPLPLPSSLSGSSTDESSSKSVEQWTSTDWHAVFEDMYRTAVGIIADSEIKQEN